MYPIEMISLHMLPDVLLINNAIKECSTPLNYELYLTDFLNLSSLFSSHGQFIRQVDQSNGECDAVSDDGYAIDFKRFGSSSSLEALNTITPMKAQTSDGMIVTMLPKRIKGMDITRIHVLFRHLSLRQLIAIDSGSNIPYGKAVSRDARDVLSILKTKKNILLFFTYHFVHKNHLPLMESDIQDICFELTKCFSSCLEFRNGFLRQSSETMFDTFFAFIAGGCMNICSCNTEITLSEQISLEKSPVFMSMYRLTNPIVKQYLKVKT